MKEDGRLVVVFLYLMCWTRAQITFEVQEELPAPLKLGNIATKANLTQTPELEFHLMSRTDLFAVDPSTGDFSAIVVLDRESQCSQSPSCVITTLVAVSGSPDFLRYTVNVTVLDTNDQKPYFKFLNFPKGLSEFAPIHTTIKLPTAEDNDFEPAFKVQKYYLQPESHDMFDLVVQRVNKSDGSVDFDVQLRLKKKLDRESNDSYTLTLVASDMGTPSNEGHLQVIITVTDENDNSPVFQKPEYSITINESTPINKTVLSVSATDADLGENGRVGYEMEISGNNDRRVMKYFEVDSASGAVKLVKSLQKEGQTVFAFKIKAFDHGTSLMSSEVHVNITVEDTVNDPPGISVILLRPKNNSSSVSEDARIGTRVAVIDVTDTDVGQNGRTHCACTSESFSMTEFSPGVYTISVAGVLDREKIATHIITIQCVDRGTPPLSSVAKLSVTVEDVNDHPPQFTRRFYEMRVRENQESGVLVGNVFATDADDGANSELRYSLDPSVVEFEINESNGFIYTAMKNLDRELKDRYNFSVYAFDTSLSPHTATATVMVNIEDVNDEWPRFENSSYRFLVSESTGTSTVIGKVHATDPDLGVGGMVEYVFVHYSLYLDPPFIVSKDSGAIILTQSLDYETTKLYSFVVTAVDLGSPPRNSSVEVHIEVIDVNDNDPIITFPNPDNLSVTLNLDVTPGQEIIRVIAHDSDHGDSGRLTYSLGALNSSVAKLFWINQDTGLLTLVAPLTQADVRSYNIVISVNDNGVPQRATQALLHIEIVHSAKEAHSRESYTTIVIIMVCVTLLVAVVVLVTLCFIKYIDKRKFDIERNIHKATFEPMDKLSNEYPHTGGGGGDEMFENMIVSPVHQKQIQPFQNQRLGSNNRNGKKCVTFDSAIRSSDTSTVSGSVSTQPDSGFSSIGSTFNSPPNSIAQVPYVPTLTSTFNPGSLDLYRSNCSAKCSPSPTSSAGPTTGPSVPLLFKTSRTNSGASLLECGAGIHSSSAEFEQMSAADEVVDTAMQNHNALVRSMRNKDRRPPYASRQPCTVAGGHDADLCSSSSMETSDSGHGGSELDVSVIKANV